MKYSITGDGLNWIANKTEIRPVKNKETGIATDKEITTRIGYYPKIHLAGMAIYNDALQGDLPPNAIQDMQKLKNTLTQAHGSAVEAVVRCVGEE